MRLYAILSLIALSGILGFVAILKGGDTIVVQGETGPTITATAQADLVASAWASNAPIAVPVADGLFGILGDTVLDNGLSVTGYAHDGAIVNEFTGRRFELHTYKVSTADNQYLDVTFTFDTTAVPQLVAYPVIAPAQSGDDANAGVFGSCGQVHCATDWTSAELTAAVEDWASAWASGNTEALRRAVGAPSVSGGDYQALGGHIYEAGSLKLISSWSDQAGSIWMQASYEISSTALVDIETGTHGPVTRTASDLLITRSNGVAHVVAWGPVGSGPTLKSYSITE